MLERRGLSDIITDEMIGEIIEGTLTGQFPTYKDLSKRFGVSTPVVTSAVFSLNRAGVLRSEGMRFFVQEPYGPKMETVAAVSRDPSGIVLKSGLERFDRSCPVSCEASARVNGEYNGAIDDDANLSIARERFRDLNAPGTVLDLIKY